jgi:MFS transporter, MHS family, proline/betaine transporter
LGGMTPTFVSLISTSPAEIPMSLAIFAVGVFVVYLVGAIVISETKGDFR